jgi:hypothetical protein
LNPNIYNAFLLFIVGYSVSLTEWEGVQSSVDKEILKRICEFEELCRENNVRTPEQLLLVLSDQ